MKKKVLKLNPDELRVLSSFTDMIVCRLHRRKTYNNFELLKLVILQEFRKKLAPKLALISVETKVSFTSLFKIAWLDQVATYDLLELDNYSGAVIMRIIQELEKKD